MPSHMRPVSQNGQLPPYPNIIAAISLRPALRGLSPSVTRAYPWGVVPSVLPGGDTRPARRGRLTLTPGGILRHSQPGRG
jgi:hypothetical protein